MLKLNPTLRTIFPKKRQKDPVENQEETSPGNKKAKGSLEEKTAKEGKTTEEKANSKKKEILEETIEKRRGPEGRRTELGRTDLGKTDLEKIDLEKTDPEETISQDWNGLKLALLSRLTKDSTSLPR